MEVFRSFSNPYCTEELCIFCTILHLRLTEWHVFGLLEEILYRKVDESNPGLLPVTWQCEPFHLPSTGFTDIWSVACSLWCNNILHGQHGRFTDASFIYSCPSWRTWCQFLCQWTTKSCCCTSILMLMICLTNNRLRRNCFLNTVCLKPVCSFFPAVRR